MNANRRLEEFILKLSTRQNKDGNFDNLNKLKQKLEGNDQLDGKRNYDKPSFSANKK